MIEATAIIIGDSIVHETAYVGHYSIVGNPERRFQATRPKRATTRATWWEDSRGAIVDEDAVVSAHVVVDDGSHIGRSAWIGVGVRIGHGTVIGPGAEIYYRAQVFDRVTVGGGATVGGFVCNDSTIGSGAQVFGSLVHRLVDAPSGANRPNPSDVEAAPIVDDQAIIGHNAIVVGGVRVGRGAYVATGSVLTHDAEPGFLYVGSPARKTRPAPSPVQSTAAGSRSTRRLYE